MNKIPKILFILLLSSQLCISQNGRVGHSVIGDTINQNIHQKNNFTYPQLFLPSSLILTGLVSNGNGPESIKNRIVTERNKHFPNFHTSVDDYLQYSPIAIAYGLYAFGAKSQTDILNRSAILVKGELYMIALTKILKRSTCIQRPDKSGYNSFPSGHTAQAFAAATFLSEEYKYKYKWMPYVSYSIASSVGILRLANNKHYISDVLVGAGIGILSMKLSYWTHQYKWNKNRKKVI